MDRHPVVKGASSQYAYTPYKSYSLCFDFVPSNQPVATEASVCDSFAAASNVST